jgi:ATP-dependent DNA helicase PIF1
MTQEQALNILKLGHNAYITGPAGSGKTYLLNQYISYLKEHDVDIGITASTGIAATHMGGVTIHSWTGLGVRDALTDYDIEALLEKPYLWKRMAKMKVLIIDEVSMLHHFRLDLIERVIQAFKGNNKPFGGIQVILCGDFFQLPPISRMGEQDAHFVYHSDAWKKADLKICYLEEQFRQTDDHALTVLNAIRENKVTEETMKHLEKSFKQNKEPVKDTGLPLTRLYTHNIDVDGVNDTALDNLPGEARTFKMASTGNDVLVSILKKSCLAPETLRLKKGALVMFVKNNFDLGYVNGTLGEVVSLSSDEGPIIRIARTGKFVNVIKESWRIEEDGKVKAELLQYPLRLAWAITVHKSQGMSLDAVEVDLSKSFERGMGYVALSRVRTLAGLTILGLNKQALEVDGDVLEYDDELRELSAQAVVEVLEKASPEKIKEQQDKYISSISPLKPKGAGKGAKISTQDATHELLLDKLSLKDIAAKRGMTEQTIIGHIEQLVEEDSKVLADVEYLRKAVSLKHFSAISEALILMHEKFGDWRLAPSKDYLDKNKKALKLSPAPTYRDIQLVKIFVKAENGT